MKGNTDESTRRINGGDVSASSATVYENYHRRNWAAFWVLGMINNFHYCLVLSAADEIATSFHLKTYVALVSWANVFFGVVVRLLNAFVFTRVPYNKRFLAAGAQTLIGIVLVSSAKYLGNSDGFRFFVALVGVVFCGNGSTFGESVALGYMERFPSTTVGGWSSGTGMSGVLASLVYMGLSAVGMSNADIFLLSIPLIAIYWVMYFFVLVVPASQEAAEASNNWKSAPWKSDELINICNTRDTLHPVSAADESSVEHAHLLASSVGEASAPSAAWSAWFLLVAFFSPARSIQCKNWWQRNWPATLHMHRITLFNNINLMVVYVAEYAIQFMAPFSFPCHLVKNSEDFWLANSFVVTQFCYQLGVLVSRSSLLCVRVRRVWVLSVVQLLNAVFWFLQAKLLIVGSADDADREKSLAFVLFAYMMFVGLFGGASYVNVFYNILELDITTTEQQNGGTNIAGHSEHQSFDSERSAHLGQQRVSEVGLSLQEKRQLMMNIGAVYAIVGISLGSLVDLIFSNTVLTDTC